nr:MAG TPA: hypothetical protein [Caudoviricetes sp.]
MNTTSIKYTYTSVSIHLLNVYYTILRIYNKVRFSPPPTTT